MNQFYRALHMPPARLAKKLAGWEEVYTVCWRRLTPGDTLPETGKGRFHALPADPQFWYADPLLFTDDEGGSWLFCEAFDRFAHKGHLTVSRMTPEGISPPRKVLEEPFHLSFPNVFRWRGEIWMLPETGADHSLRLYRCAEFPVKWELAARFPYDGELCDAIITENTEEKLEILCSETLPSDQLQVMYRLFTLTAGEDGLTLTPDTGYNEAQQWNYCDRNAGPLFELNGAEYRPAQLSTDIDYGVCLQFWRQTDEGEQPEKVVGCGDVELSGVPAANLVGIHTYCKNREFEIIDARYLRFYPSRFLKNRR